MMAASSRDEFDDFFDDDDDKPVTDTRADGRLYRVPLARLAPNLVNPRTDFGTEDQLIDLGKSLARRQNQPCPVVSRSSYLKLWPEHAGHLGAVDYVLVSGERRFRAATAVGLTALDCVANDDFARDRRAFMEAVVSENVDRQNFDPVEEAYAVQALVAEFGSNRAVAQHFERADGWVTQRILLTHLAREVQHLVRQKTIPLEAARSLGKLARDKRWSASEQLEWWAQEQQRRAAVSHARAEAKRAPREESPAPVQQPALTQPPQAPLVPAGPPAGQEEQPPSFTAVKPEPLAEAHPAAPDPAPDRHEAAQPAEDEPESQQVPEPRAESDQAVPEGRGLPYDNGVIVAWHLIRKMPADAFADMLRVMNQHAAERGLEVGAPTS